MFLITGKQNLCAQTQGKNSPNSCRQSCSMTFFFSYNRLTKHKRIKMPLQVAIAPRAHGS